MILQVFADESDICNNGSTPTICALVQTRDYWVAFDKKWKRVLKNYAAPYFHFREFADRKNQEVIENSPYRNWSEKKKDGFLYDLALLCAEATVPVLSSYDAKSHRRLALKSNIYETVIETFFESLSRELNRQWPRYRENVMLLFDSSSNKDWLVPLHNTHERYKLLDPRLDGTLAFDNDKKVPALQAADLFAYVVRQQAERWLARRANGDGESPPIRLLDFAFRKNMEIGAKDSNFRRWKHLFTTILEDQRKKQAQWKREGNPSKRYYPAEHFPHLFSYSKDRPTEEGGKL